MFIDKTLPFYTEQDNIKISKYHKAMDDCLKESHAYTEQMIEAREKGDKALFDSLHARSGDIWLNRFPKLSEELEDIYLSIRQRYAASFKGDTAAILRDAEEVVAALEKEDYILYQKRLNETVQGILANKPTKDSTPLEKRGYAAAKTLSVQGYSNCYIFILKMLRPQHEALESLKIDSELDKLFSIIERRASSFYKKPKSSKPIPLKEVPTEVLDLPIRERAEIHGELLTLPTSPTLSLLYDVLGGGDLDELPERKQRYNRNQQIIIEEQGDSRRVSYENDKTTVSIQIDDFRKVVNRNPQTNKILTRILLKANEQAIHNGELTRGRVSFSLRELVGEGQYKNLDTARQGFYNITGTLVGIKVSGKVERGKKKTLQQGRHEVLFTGAGVANGICEVFLNERLNWGLIVPFYTGLPDYYFELPDRAAELLQFIFNIARQNTKQIAERGYFTISYRAIQHRLNLPNEVQNGKPINNPKRDIKDAIENAIEQIEEKYCKYAPPIPKDATGEDAIPDFSLLPMADYDAPIKKYLDEGKLKVSLKGDYAKRFIELSQRTAAKVEAAKKRRERIEERAKAINLAKYEEKAARQE